MSIEAVPLSHIIGERVAGVEGDDALIGRLDQ
jgi:hypothetical protein